MEFAIQHTLSSKDIKLMRKRLGLKQKDFAALLNVSVKTVERWEEADVTVTGPAVTLLKILYETPEWVEELQIPTKIYPLRLFYYYKESLCTVIDVNELTIECAYNPVEESAKRFEKREKIKCYTGDYEEFLESRCFPRSRDKMKIILRDLGLPFYDPFLIIQKTKGKMAEDDFWIEIER